MLVMISLIQPSPWWVQGRGELLEVRLGPLAWSWKHQLLFQWPRGWDQPEDVHCMKTGAGEGRENRRVSRKFLPMAWGWLQDGPRWQHGCQQTPEPGLTEAKEEEQTLRTL